MFLIFVPNFRTNLYAEVRNIFPSMSVPREYYFDGCDTGFLDDRGGNMINPRVGHPLYLQVCLGKRNGQ